MTTIIDRETRLLIQSTASTVARLIHDRVASGDAEGLDFLRGIIPPDNLDRLIAKAEDNWTNINEGIEELL